MALDLTAAKRQIDEKRASASALIEQSIDAAGSPSCALAFIATSFDSARAAAHAVDRAASSSSSIGALAGLAVSVKDLFDVAGEVTAAGSTLLAAAAPAAHDAPAVARLRSAGAAFIGRTNMSEFAFSGVGINPHPPTTPPSLPPTLLCCAIRASSTCSTAAPSACRATTATSFRSA